MELYREILADYLSGQRMQITFPGLEVNAKEIVEMQCYQALNQIKAIIQNGDLDDEECFLKIEEIICVLEEVGRSGGVRHDFG